MQHRGYHNGCTWLYLAVLGYVWMYLAVCGCIRLYLAAPLPQVSEGIGGLRFQISLATSYLTEIDTRQKDLQCSTE